MKRDGKQQGYFVKFLTFASVCRSKTKRSMKDVIPDTSIVICCCSDSGEFQWPSERSKHVYADKYFLTTHFQNTKWRHQLLSTWRILQSWNLYGDAILIFNGRQPMKARLQTLRLGHDNDFQCLVKHLITISACFCDFTKWDVWRLNKITDWFFGLLKWWFWQEVPT